ncbi:MAG TPA: SDR family oxidoreductase [Acidimicrobiia bacterium]|nr:SDR family oxidoreductase [Acidimicrobiia bacterium]
MPHNLLEGKVVIVTGGGRSLGAIIAGACREEGAVAVATDVTRAEGTDVVPHDVTVAGDWERVVADTVAEHGRVDGLVNNAAIILPARPFLDEPPDEFARLLDVNVKGVWLGMQAAGRSMGETGGGSIVNISSTAGMAAHPRLSSYGTSKWAVRGLTKYGARELGPSGIRVNSVHPGGMMGTTMFPGTTDEEAYEQARKRAPLRRVTHARDVADAVVWLLSDLSRQVTGREMVVDAGATLDSA